MTALSITIIGIVAAILTLWLVVIPAGMLVGCFSAFRHEGHGWQDWRRHS